MTPDALHRRSFLIRYLTLFGGEVTSKLCVLLAFGYLARVLGPRDFGAIEFALSLTLFFVLGAEMGLGSYGARLVEASPHLAGLLLPRAGLVRAAIALPAYLILLALASRDPSSGPGLLAVYGLAVLLTPLNTQWVFQGLRQMHWVAAGSLLRYGTFAAIVLLLVRRDTDIRTVAAAEVAGATAIAVFNAVVVGRVLKIRLDWRGAWAGAKAILRDAWFLGASELTWAVMWYAPTIALGWVVLERTEQVAWLASAVRIVMALHTFVFLYFFNMLPNLSAELREGLDHWRALVRRSLSLSMWVACFVAVAGSLAAPMVMSVLFGGAYHAAAWPFRVLVWMIPVAWLSGHFRFSLIVAGKQGREFRAAAIGGMTTIGLALAGASWYGAVGAAGALLAGGIVNAIAAGVELKRCVGPVPLAPAVPAFATTVAAILIGLVTSAFAGATPAAIAASLFYVSVAALQIDYGQLLSVWQRPGLTRSL